MFLESGDYDSVSLFEDGTRTYLIKEYKVNVVDGSSVLRNSAGNVIPLSERFNLSPGSNALATSSDSTKSLSQTVKNSKEPADEKQTSGSSEVAGEEGPGRTDTVGGAGAAKGGSRGTPAKDVSGFESAFGESVPDSGVSKPTVEVAGQPAAGGDGGSVSGDRAKPVVSNSTGGNNATVPESDASNSNYRLIDKSPVLLTKSQRKTYNSQAKALIKRGGPFNDDEREVLRQYTGEGGLSSGTEEALTQHYTSYDVIRSMYDAIEDAGFEPKKALEPSVGSGNFVGMRPDLDWTTVDIDKTNHEVTKALYPQGKHYLTSFEDFRADGFDLVISNVPFLEQRTSSGKKTRPDIPTLHDFYFAHAIDRVKDNGVVAFVTSRGSMDKKGNTVRKELMEKGDLLGAFRLPSSTFEKNAHTSVITDVIFIQKRPAGAKVSDEQQAINDSFVDATETSDGIVLNNYYHDRMENMLGDVTVGKDKARFGRETYQITGDADLSRIQIKRNDYKVAKKTALSKGVSRIPTDSKEFDKWVAENDVMTQRSALTANGADGDKTTVAPQSQYLDRNILYNDETGTFYAFDKSVEFSDVRGSAKVYRPAPKSISNKLELLKKIAHMADQFQRTGEPRYKMDGVKAIEEYQEQFKKHPSKDMKLKPFMNKLGEQGYLAEIGSYFDKDFTPSSVFETQTRFTGSGKAKVKASDPLKVRAFASEDNTGSINLSEAEYVGMADLPRLIKSGYAVSRIDGDSTVVQNEVLYFSGNIYDKISRAKRAMQMTDDPAVKAGIQQQIDTLEEAKPIPEKLDSIRFKGVEPWLRPILERSLVFAPTSAADKRSGETKWSSGDKIFDNFLNGNQLVSKPERESDALFLRRVKDAEEHVDRRIKQIKDRIDQAGITEEVELAYNSRFRNYVKPDYQKAEYLIRDVLEEIDQNTNGKIKLRKNQIEWVIQAVYEGKGINAHDVGGGKTMAAIVLARVMQKRGMAHKPLFVVPAKTIKKWQKETKMLFPDAKIVDLGNLSADKRTEALFNLANQTADYVYISTEGFEKIKLPADAERRYIEAVAFENLHDDDATGRAAGKDMQKLNDFIRIVSERPRDTRLTFDKLGIDMIIADEAHAYKNIGISAKLNKWGLGTNFGVTVKSNIPKIVFVPETDRYYFVHPKTKRKCFFDSNKRFFDSISDARDEAKKAMTEAGVESETASIKSARSYDFRFKANWINENNNGKNVFLLTATPTPNKPLEVYSMLRHLDPKIFEEYGINSAKDFADTFFKLGTVKDPAKGKPVNVLKAIVNAQCYAESLTAT